MKTLLERLKPEYFELLKEVKTLYPSIHHSIVKELTQNNYYEDLKIFDALHLRTFLTEGSIDLYDLNSELFEIIIY